MKRAVAILAVPLLAVTLYSGSASALEVASLWPKILNIIEKLDGIQEQNETIINNQKLILQQIRELREGNQSGKNAEKED